MKETSNPAGSPKITDITPAPPPQLDQTAPEEFTRFEGLARKLVNVPKNEVDEKRATGS